MVIRCYGDKQLVAVLGALKSQDYYTLDYTTEDARYVMRSEFFTALKFLRERFKKHKMEDIKHDK